uniref:Uncharacterized protein n=1 Tax=Rhizophora mucronata TaxID=61149 RepID=A0A2P2PVT0_RHIMU
MKMIVFMIMQKSITLRFLQAAGKT